MPIEAARLSVVVDADTSAAEGALHRFGGALGGAGRALGTAALGAAGFAVVAGGATVAAAMSLEDSLTPIGTLLGTTTPQFHELSGSLKDFMANSPSSGADIGSAAYMALSAGITDSTQVMGALTAAQQLAQAGLGDIGGGMDLVTSAMNSFTGEGLTADQAAKAFFGTVASGKTTTADLAQGFGQIAPLAAGAGVKFNDLLAATAALTSTGQSASTAYAGIKGALSAVISPTAEAAETAKKLGLNFSQAHLASVGLPAFLNEVKTATGGNVETMAQLFGGVEGLNTVMALTGPQSEAFAANLTNIGVAGENLAARSAEVEGSISNRFKELKNKVGVSMGEFGLKVNDGVMAMVAAFKTGDVTAGGFTGTLQGIAVRGRELVDSFKEHWPQIKRTMADAMTAIGQAWESHGRPALDAIIAAGEAVIGWVRVNWPQISQIIGQALATVQIVVQSVVDIVSTIWNNFGSQIVDFTRSTWEAARTAIEGALNIIQGIVKTVTALIHGDWQAVWEGIKQTLQGVWQVMLSIVEMSLARIKAVISVAWEVVRSVTASAWEGIRNAVVAAGSAIVSFIATLPGRFLSALGDLGGLLVNAGVRLMGGLFGGIVSGLGGLVSLIGSIPGRILSALGDVGSLLFSAGVRIIGGLVSGIVSAVATTLKRAVSGIAGQIVAWKGPLDYDETVLVPNGLALMAGLTAGIEKGLPSLERLVSGIAPSLAVSAAPGYATFPTTGGGGSTIVNYNLRVDVAPTADLAAVGRSITEAIIAHERRAGATWRTRATI